MRKCTNCNADIEEKVMNCSNCGALNFLATRSSSKENKPWYKKWWVIVIGVILLLNLLGAIISGPSNKRTNQTRASSGGNNLYFTGYSLGSSLAVQHSYYKGSSYIERECKGFVGNYVGGSSTRDADYVFIRGCVNGYKEAFGK